MTAANLMTRSLIDDEIIKLACFPILEPKKASREDYLLAKLMDVLGKTGANPLAVVTWPTGVKGCAVMHPGDRSASARETLIRMYRFAEAGNHGVVPGEDAR